MGRRQQWVYHVQPEEFPPDFPERLDAFRQAAGLSWRGLARQLRVNARLVFRWKAGATPASGHLVSLFTLAAGMGLLHLLLPEVGEQKEDRSIPFSRGDHRQIVMLMKPRYCAQYVTRGGKRVPCDRPCIGFYCGKHGGQDAE